MGQGQGSISVNQKAATGGAVPPFPLGAANNGLSVDPVSFDIVLGQSIGAAGNPSQFLDDREIEMSNFFFQMVNGGNRQLFIDSINRVFQAGDVSNAGNSFKLSIDDVQERIFLGDDNAFVNPSIFVRGKAFSNPLIDCFIPDATNTKYIDLSMFHNPGAAFVVDMFGTNNYRLDWRLDQIGGDFLEITSRPGFVFRDFFIDFINSIYQFGDIDAQFNGNFLTIDDGIQEWGIGQRAAITNLLLNKPAAGIGLSYFDEAGNNPFLIPSAGTGGISFLSAPDFTTQISLADAGSGSQGIIGDVGSLTTGMKLSVNVPANEIQIANTALNSKVRINNVLGFTGTVAPPLTITVNGGIVTNVA